MQVRRVATMVFALALLSTPAVAQVQLTINGGRVSLSAKNATAVQILSEWAKVGQTKIVNPERVIGGPLTIELTANVSELEAIDILLRSAGGYVLAPRRIEAANASQFDRILILPAGTGRPTATAAVAQAPPPRPPQFAPPPMPFDDSDDPNAGPPAAVNGRPPVFSTFPQPQQRPSPPPPANVPVMVPTAPAGVSIPGMVAPAPTPVPAQGQPGTPETPQ